MLLWNNFEFLIDLWSITDINNKESYSVLPNFCDDNRDLKSK